jgi:hypothetical protein
MSEQQPNLDVPTLNYYDQPGEDAWVLMRFILLAIAISSAFTAVAGFANTFQRMGSLVGIRGFWQLPATSYLYLVFSPAHDIAAVLLAVGCAWGAQGRNGRTLTIWSAAARIVFNWMLSGVYLFDYLQMSLRQQQQSWLLWATVQTILFAFSMTVVPVMLIILLRRPLVKRMFRG